MDKIPLNIGGEKYSVGIPLIGIVDDGGGRLWGRNNPEHNRIEIDETCPLRRRLETIAHEVAHAWLEFMPLPRTEEEFCNAIGRIAARLATDLERAGGTARLLLLGRQRAVITPRELSELNPTDRIDAGANQCNKCGTSIAPGSIVRDGPHKHAHSATGVIRLRFVCTFCEKLVVWIEQASPGGLPNGIQVEKQRQTGGEELTEFCRDYPDESGIIV